MIEMPRAITDTANKKCKLKYNKSKFNLRVIYKLIFIINQINSSFNKCH